jgi:hypothetical protein
MMRRVVLPEAASSPLRWPPFEVDARYRRAVVRRFPYLLFYEVRGDLIEFVAVAHVRREPGYWLSRALPRDVGGEGRR